MKIKNYFQKCLITVTVITAAMVSFCSAQCTTTISGPTCLVNTSCNSSTAPSGTYTGSPFGVAYRWYLECPSCSTFTLIDETHVDNYMFTGGTGVFDECGTWTVKVRRFCDTGGSNGTATMTVFVPNNANLCPNRESQISSVTILEVYPNPTTNLISVNGIEGYNHYYISDQSGRILLTGEIDVSEENLQIGIKNFNPGIYFIHFIGNSTSPVIEKIIKE